MKATRTRLLNDHSFNQCRVVLFYQCDEFIVFVTLEMLGINIQTLNAVVPHNQTNRIGVGKWFEIGDGFVYCFLPSLDCWNLGIGSQRNRLESVVDVFFGNLCDVHFLLSLCFGCYLINAQLSQLRL